MSLNLGIIASSRTVASASLLLDTYAGAAAAYSLRKLRTAYTGAAIRVRRSSDNTETDIGFNVGGGLDTTALTTFVGVNSGFITTWYDQSVNVKNLIQTTTANQPSIIIAGVNNTVNNKISIFFDGSNDSMSNTTLNASQTSLSLFEVFKINDASIFVVNTINTQYNMAGNSGGGGGADSLTILSRYKNSTLTTSSTQGQVWTLFNTNAQILCSQFINITGNITSFGISNFPGGWNLTGYYQEVILYPTSQTSNRTAIETNINSYYTIY